MGIFGGVKSAKAAMFHSQSDISSKTLHKVQCNIDRFSSSTFSLHSQGYVKIFSAIFNSQFDERSYYLASNAENTAGNGFVAKLLTKEKVDEENRSMLHWTLCNVLLDLLTEFSIIVKGCRVAVIANFLLYLACSFFKYSVSVSSEQCVHQKTKKNSESCRRKLLYWIPTIQSINNINST